MAPAVTRLTTHTTSWLTDIRQSVLAKKKTTRDRWSSRKLDISLFLAPKLLQSSKKEYLSRFWVYYLGGDLNEVRNLEKWCLYLFNTSTVRLIERNSKERKILILLEQTNWKWVTKTKVICFCSNFLFMRPRAYVATTAKLGSWAH